MKNIQNIYSSIPADIPEELFLDVLKTDSVRIERIVSKGHTSPEGFWYDQDHNEWVMLLKGSAHMMFEGSDEIIELKTGNYIHIPAHTRHRVEWTEPKSETIWLAVIF
ncbi:MAG: cupin domain-containing protein [Desulfobacterales bacterium]|nr:cupin domain-containing protein [Desulfobacteraceae bacterium]MBT4365649.1 cupin domain-containing protein [Desulfobacteraceae bacterium]MBT7086056.1 cupin domain-containing protein [Desulfobacterales bacterium]